MVEFFALPEGLNLAFSWKIIVVVLGHLKAGSLATLFMGLESGDLLASGT